MKSHIIALAALAAIGFAGGAYAKDAKPTVTPPTAMSDSEMDKVTAGDPGALRISTQGVARALVGAGPEGQGGSQRLENNGSKSSHFNQGARFDPPV